MKTDVTEVLATIYIGSFVI